MHCVRGFCLDALEAGQPAPPATPPPVVQPEEDAGRLVCMAETDAACTCATNAMCPMGESCCSGTCRASCAAMCGNGVVDESEQCDGGPLCSKGCAWLFDASLVHRYSFSGKGKEVLDSVGAASGMVVGADLLGVGDLALAGGTTDQFVNLPNGLLRGLSGATLELWFTWTGAAGEHVLDFGFNTSGEDKHTGAATTYLYISPHDDKTNLAAHVNFTMTPGDVDKDVVVQASGALSKRVPHQVVVTFDGVANQLELYLDGEFVDRAIDIKGMLAQIDDRNVWLGRSNSPGNSFKGTLHEFRLYSRPLKADAIKASFVAGTDPAAL